MGWYEDWQRQNLAFNPRMDQGGGEYTGYIKDVYEGDDAMPGQEFFPGPSTAQQGRMGMLTPLQIAQQRKAKGDFTSAPGAASLLAASDHQRLGGGPNVGSLDYQRELALNGPITDSIPTSAVANGVAAPFDPGGGDHSVNWYDTVKDIYGFGKEALTPLSEVQNALVAGGADLAQRTGDAIPQYLKDPVLGAVDTGVGWVKDASRYPPYGELLDKGAASLKKWLGGGVPSVSATPVVTTASQNTTPTIANMLSGDPFSEDDNLQRGAVPTNIFPTGASEAPDPLREASDRNLQDILAARDRGELTPISSPGEVDAEAPQSLSEMLGAGPAAAAFATTTTAAVGGAELLRREGVKSWRNSTKGQLSQLRKDLAENTKAMAIEDPSKFGSHTRAIDADLKAKIAELESKETLRQRARASINKKLSMAKGGLTKFGKTAASGLKKGLLGAIPTAALGGVAYASWKYGISKANAATADGVLGDVSDMSEEERIAILYEASAIGDLDGTPYANFASRMDQFDSAGNTAGGIAEILNPMGGAFEKSYRMGPARENYWAIPGIGSADGAIDPNWRD